MKIYLLSVEMTISSDIIKVEVEIECDEEAELLTDVEWFMLSGGSPRRDRSRRRNVKGKAWKLVDLCTWIGKKVSNK